MKVDVTAENKPTYQPLGKIWPLARQSKFPRKRTHKDRSGVHVIVVLFDNVAVIVIGHVLELVVKLGATAPRRYGKVWKTLYA